MNEIHEIPKPQFIQPVINPSLLRNWHVALLSGVYTQGTGNMEVKNDDDGVYNDELRLCCLGVLCRVAMAQGIEVPVSNKDCPETYFGAEEHAGVLPAEVTNVLFGTAGEDDDWDAFRDPYLIMEEGKPECATAADLNDSHAYSFEQIAAAIKRTWPEAFTD